jgi:multidrug resistance protein
MRRLSVLMAVAFVDMIGLMLVLPLLPLYALKLNATATLIGFLTASFPVAQLLASPVWGRVSDRYGRRPALIVGLTASALAYIVFGFAGSLWLLFVSRFVQGLGGGTTGVAQAYVADTMPPHERAKALGWLSAATSLGVVIGPVVGSFAARGGQAAPGLVAAALCLSNVAFAWKWLPESRVLPSHATSASGRHVPPPEPRPVLQAVRDVVLHPGRPAALVIWIYAVAMLAYNSAPAVFTLYLSWRFGIDVTNIGWFFTVFGGVGVLMRAFVVGPVNDRFGEVRTMRLGAGLYALGYALLPLATSIPAFLGFQVFLPLGTALLFPATSALVSHRTDQHEFGLMMGVQQAMRGVASVAGPIWAGFAY